MLTSSSTSLIWMIIMPRTMPIWFGPSKVHNEPMGFYSRTIKNLDELPDGAKVGIPNDATNGGRALMVLEQAKLITLKEGARGYRN